MGIGRELAGRHRDGTEFAVEVSLTPVEVRGTRYAAAFVRDGRERQRGIDSLHAVNEVTQSLLVGTRSGEVLPLVARTAPAASPTRTPPGSSPRLARATWSLVPWTDLVPRCCSVLPFPQTAAGQPK